jgi:hypothetical protein
MATATGRVADRVADALHASGRKRRFPASEAIGPDDEVDRAPEPAVVAPPVRSSASDDPLDDRFFTDDIPRAWQRFGQQLYAFWQHKRDVS